MSLRPRWVAAGVAGLAYVTASQWLMTRTPPSPWGAVALLAPMLAIVAIGTWRSGQRALSLLAAAALAVLVGGTGLGGGIAPEQLYLAEHVAIHLFLAFTFGTTLRHGAQPLISRLAEHVHGPLVPEMARYTRKVTIAWTVYFCTLATLSLAIHALAPFATWAVFANLLTPLALLAMFVGEYLLRYRLHPEFERVSVNDMIRAYAHSRRTVPATPPAVPPLP